MKRWHWWVSAAALVVVVGWQAFAGRPAKSAQETPLVRPGPIELATEKPTDSALDDEWLHGMSERAARYVPGNGDEVELEGFWQSCGPIDPERLEALAAELRARVQYFESMKANFALASGPLPQADGSWTQRDFFALYSGIGLNEARFLLAECVAGRMREAPFQPVPPTVLDSTHPSAQLVPHVSPAMQSAYVARLDAGVDPALFSDRPMIYAIALRVLGGEGDSALQSKARQSFLNGRDG